MRFSAQSFSVLIAALPCCLAASPNAVFPDTAVADTMPAIPGAIAAWDFDEGAGDTLHDRTGNGHHGIIRGARWVDGVKGKALLFDGKSMVEVPGDSATQVESFTLSTWLWQSGNSVRMPLMEFHAPNATVGVHLWANSSGWGENVPGSFYVNLRPLDANSSQPSSVRERNIFNTGAATTQGGRWNHVVLAYDQATRKARVHVNGKLQAFRTLEPFTPRTVGSLFLGMRTPTSVDGDAGMALLGTLDQASLYGRALDEAEIRTLYGQLPVDPGSIHLGLKTHHARAGDTLWIPLYLSSVGRDSLSSLRCQVEIDTTVATLLDVRMDTALAPGWTVEEWTPLAGSPVPLALAGRPLLGDLDGELLRFKVKVRADARTGAATVLKLSGISGDEGRLAALSHTPGKIFVLDPDILPGDVTGDGAVDLVDAGVILLHVVGKLPLPSAEFPAFTVAVADVSGNGEVTAYDAALVLQFGLGILEEFPVQPKPLAKRAASGRLAVSAATPVEGNVWRFRIQAEGLGGLMGGKLSFEGLGAVTSIVRVASPIAGLRASYRFDPATRRLDVALAGNRRLAAGAAADFLEVDATYPAETSARGLILRGAELNEGSLTAEGAEPDPVRVTGPVRASLAGDPILSWDGARVRFEVPGHSLLAAEVLDIRGRRVAVQRHAAPVAAVTFSRSALPEGLLILRASGKDGSWTRILPSLAP